MGVVYKAEDTKLERTVAIKFLPPHIAGNDEERKRFKIEAKAAASLNHNNISTIYNFEEDDSETFIVMEYIKGQELKDRIEASPLALDDTLSIAVQIAQGLQIAHEEGVVHRDIKSSNIMLTDRGGVKIMDFGLAKLDSQTKLTKEGTTLGTVAYMSPEQARGDEVDGRSDIFSLGVLIYEMLTGQLPFKGDYDQAVTYSILNEVPEPVTCLRSGIPMELERIVNKCLEKDGPERYQSADDLIVDLRKLKKGSDLHAILPKTGGTQSQPIHGTPQHIQSKKPAAYYRLAILLRLIAVVSTAYFFSRERPIDSIAVMPFANSNNDPDIDYLSDGLTETLIIKLSQLPQLRVMARNTVFRLKGQDLTSQQIGEQLNVRAVLMGQIVQRGAALRVNAELVDVSDGAQIWGDQYDGTLDDIFTVQDAISEQISTSLRLKLCSEEKSRLVTRQTENREAYELYLKGRFFWNLRTGADLQTALDHFEQAIAKDPDYALAYAGIADCYELFSVYAVLTPNESFPKAKEAALKALELDSQLAEARASLAITYSTFDWDWVRAEKSYIRSLELNPNYPTAHQWYGEDLAYRSRFDEAIAELEQALTLDPLSPIITAVYGLTLGQAGHHENAVEQLQKAIKMDNTFPAAQYLLGQVYLINGEAAKSIYHFQEAFRLDNDPLILGMLGYALAISGKTEDADKILAQMDELSSERTVSPYGYAEVHAGLGNIEKAFEYLQLSMDQKSTFLLGLSVDPFFVDLRSDPRFDELLIKWDWNDCDASSLRISSLHIEPLTLSSRISIIHPFSI